MPGQTGGDLELTSSQPQQASAQNQRVAAKPTAESSPST